MNRDELPYLFGDAQKKQLFGDYWLRVDFDCAIFIERRQKLVDSVIAVGDPRLRLCCIEDCCKEHMLHGKGSLVKEAAQHLLFSGMLGTVDVIFYSMC